MSINLPLYDEELQTYMLEGLVQNIDVLNSSSAGAILMGTGNFFGDFERTAHFDRMANLVERRDIDSSAAATPTTTSLIEDVAVNLDYRVRAKDSVENFKRRGGSIDQFIRLVGEQFAEDLVKRYLNLSVSALIAAVGSNASMTDTTLNTATTNIDHLLKAEELYGEKYGDIKAFMMNSQSYHALRKSESDILISNVAGIVIAEGMTATLGRPVIVSNIPSLTYDDTGTQRNRIMALTEGAITLTERGDRTTLIDTDGLGENISTLVAVDGTIKCDLKGYSYDEASGGKSPNDAAMATGANWNLITSNELSGASMVEALA